MDMLDDLLIKRRRGTLQRAEARRLEIALAASREHQLALHAGDAFDVEGAPEAGDEELLRRLTGAVEQRWFGSGTRRSVRRIVAPLAGALIFVAGAAAASYGGYRVFEALRETPQSSAPTALTPPTSTRMGSRAARVSPTAGETPAQPGDVETASVPVVREMPRAFSSKQAQGSVGQLRRQRRARVERVSPERRDADGQGGARLLQHESAPLTLEAESELLSADPEPARVEPEPMPPPVAARPSAATLFQRAQRLRQSDWYAAELMYRRIVDEHPESSEAGVAEMALGKRALATGRERDALIWFRAHERRAGSPLSAEALWGQARALEALGRAPDARAVWRRLIERHPGSPYAPVARQRSGSDQ